MITTSVEPQGDVQNTGVVGVEVDRDERPQRNRKPPNRFGQWEYASVAVHGSDDTKTLIQAMKGENAEHWRKAADDEYNSLMKNKTWDSADVPDGVNIVGCKWVLKD